MDALKMENKSLLKEKFGFNKINLEYKGQIEAL